MAASTDQIIEFSGIGEFIDESVKIYSSGMVDKGANTLRTHD